MELDRDNIKVIVRVRPLNTREKCENAKSCLSYSEDPQRIILDCKPEPRVFCFDFIANENMSQNDLFTVFGKSICDYGLEGYNVCLFAYGQTGAGKTYTMQGSLDPFDKSEWGLQPRIIDNIFILLSQMKKNSYDFLVKCSYIEVYNEQIIDLVFIYREIYYIFIKLVK